MSEITRRTLVRGIAWATPVVVATAAVPAYAASQFTSKTSAAYLYSEIKTRTPAYCNVSSNPQQGYISTTGSGNDPNTSNGLWFEGSGSVKVTSATVQYVFNHPVQLQNAPTNMNWSTPTTLNGWTLTQVDPYTIQLTKSNMEGTESTSTINTGTNFGNYFVNFKVTDGCFGDAVVQVRTVATVNYVDSTGTHTYTKNTAFMGI